MAELRDLGLSEYEARAYRALLGAGPTTAKELSEDSGVPMGRVYDVLNQLEQYSLVRSQSASRPKKYVAVEPEPALQRLLERRRRELSARERQYEETVEELTADLGGAAPPEEPFWTAAIGQEETVDLLTERIAAADERVLMVASGLTGAYDMAEVGERVAAAMADALDRGVAVRLLMRPALVADLPPSVGERYRETLAPHDRFGCRVSGEVSSSLTVIDGTEVCIEVPHPLRADETFAIIDLQDSGFAGETVAEFDPRWEAATPLELR
jgi:sugar-specific transcriptional regulator TrmB